jgi:hypothetical protein
MSRSSRKRKPNGGGTTYSGAPGSGPTNTVQKGIAHSTLGIDLFAPLHYLAGVDQSVAAEFPTFRSVLTNQPSLIQFESHTCNFSSLVDQATGTLTFLTQPLINMRDLAYNQMLDAVARKWGNAQGLALGTPADFGSFVAQYMQVYAELVSLASILNSDGYNTTLSKMAVAGNQYRNRIQNAFDRLQTVPMAPGVIDLILRLFGCFCEYEGATAYMLIQHTAGGSPLDMTSSASWSTLVTAMEGELAGITSVSEQAAIRVVLEETFGNPIPLPVPGMRVSRGLVEMLRTSTMPVQQTTNVFGFPFVNNGGSVLQDVTIPLLVPVGYEGDMLWSTLMRYNALNCFSNVAKATENIIGLFASLSTQNFTYAWYTPTGVVTIPVIGTVTDDGNPTDELPWLIPAIASRTLMAGIGLGMSNYSVFEVPFSWMIDQTVQFYGLLFVKGGRVPYPAGTKDLSVGKIRSRTPGSQVS